jgi:hypothetical protein
VVQHIVLLKWKPGVVILAPHAPVKIDLGWSAR